MAAANALESITSICRNHLTSHLSILLRVVELLASLPINTETAVKVVKGITKVCNRLPPHQVTDVVLQLCKVHVEQLRNICQVNSKLENNLKNFFIFFFFFFKFLECGRC